MLWTFRLWSDGCWVMFFLPSLRILICCNIRNWIKNEPTGLLFFYCIDVYKLWSEALTVMWLHEAHACFGTFSGWSETTVCVNASMLLCFWNYLPTNLHRVPILFGWELALVLFYLSSGLLTTHLLAIYMFHVPLPWTEEFTYLRI